MLYTLLTATLFVAISGIHRVLRPSLFKNWIITAGHCTYEDISLTEIRAGTDLREKGGSLHKVDKIIRHEKYGQKSSGVPLNDIALIRVKEPFVFDETRQPVELVAAGEKSAPGKMTKVSGFGFDRSNSLTENLKSVQVPLLDYDTCNRAYLEPYGRVPEGFICAAYFGEGRRNSCKGDSGGPLTVDGRLTGIVSWSYKCAKPDYPTVYTDVAYYRDWIDQHIEY